ncbi:MAG TPA: phosphotransferase [Trebonia sp.]|nr:phosphotransferase [Trebonia sp.]
MLNRAELLQGWMSGMRRMMASGCYADDFRSSYGPDVIFGGYVPGEVVALRGRDDVAQVLTRWHPSPAEIAHWSATEFADAVGEICGARLDVEWRFDGQLQRHRRSHLVHLGDAGIYRHVVFSARPAADSLPAGEPGPALAELYASARGRRAVGAGTSATPMQQITTDSGETVFVKWFVPDQGWQGRLTADTGREAMLWSQGWLDQLPAGVSHPIIAAEPYGDGIWVTVSRDVTPNLVRGKRLALSQMRDYIAALDRMYGVFVGREPPDGLATMEERWGIFWPAAVASEHDQPDGFIKGVARGWDLLDEAVDDDVVDVVRAVVADPAAITGRLRPSFLHGDACPANVAIEGSTLVLFDWSLATAGPPENEGAWLANFAQFYRFSTDELLELWRSVRGPEHDETAFGLSLLGQASGLIPALLTSVVDYPDPVHRAFSRMKLEWWMGIVRRYQHLLSP